MKKQKYESGFAHLIIIIVVIVVLLGALGFVYWQNNIKKNDDTAQDKPVIINGTDKNITATADTKTLSFNPSAKNLAFFTYPSDWTIERTTSEGVDNISATEGSDNIKIYSPSKKVYVEIQYVVVNVPFGFECFEAEYDQYVSFLSTSLMGYPDMAYVESVVKNVNDGYFYESYLISPVNQTTQPKSYCSSNEKNVIERVAPLENDYGIHVIWYGVVKATDYMTDDGMDKYFIGTSEIDTLLGSDDYKTAKNILLSAKLSS